MDEEQSYPGELATPEELEGQALESAEEEGGSAAELATAEPVEVGGGRSVFIPRVEGLGRRAGELAGSALGGIGEAIGNPPGPDDDLSDLFRGPDPYDADVYCEDLVSIDEEDIFGEGGEDMSDILEVSEEDIFGEGGEDMSDLLGTGNGRNGRGSFKRPGRRLSLPGKVPTSGISGMRT